MENFWHAKTYSLFLDLRTRPARDLLAAVPNSFEPSVVYDLGCGPGNSTVLLKNRWPDAKVVGVDSSIDMLKQAKETYPDIDFFEGDIADFSPQEEIDCLFANASLQWLDHHEVLIPKLLKFVKPGGIFAFQIPNNFHSPSHQTAVKVLQHNPAWQPLLKNLRYGALTKPFYHLPWYYDVLANANTDAIQLWETEYFQEMSDYQAIFDWVKGTGIRPALTAMDTDNQIQFEKVYLTEIAKEYPLQTNHKVLLPYRRIFIVGYV